MQLNKKRKTGRPPSEASACRGSPSVTAKLPLNCRDRTSEIVSGRALRPEEVSGGHAQSLSQLEKLESGRVANAALDATHVAAAKAR